ncbi:MAG TPA: signal peptide peptidase SppA [Thermodesulfobacteriaceae bacterium]|nr:signal peptide peptidase SppA [Thermodesulfobacteriaceae bacterium]
MAEEQRRASSSFLIVFATIGGLAVLSAVAFFILVFWISRGISPVPPVSGGGEKIGVVEIKGVIADPEKILKDLRGFGEDQDVSAVVVRINSPGGAVGASQEIFQEIRRLDSRKPVVASFGSVAASGGYYASLGARRIVANPGTVTGSIGVIMKIPNIGPLLEKLGIRTTVIKSGALKDLGSVTREMTPEERDVVEGIMNDIQGQFVADVASSRKISEDKVIPVADGRIISGRQALDLGLVDELGNFSTAVERAASLAGVQGRPVLVYPREDRFTMLRKFLEEGSANAMVRFFRQVAAAPGDELVY